MLGYLHEQLIETQKKLAEFHRPGRPRKSKLEDIDIVRAVALWDFAHNLAATVHNRPVDTTKPCSISVRHLIELAQVIDDKLFPQTTSFSSLEQSVSKGRRKLGIGRDWLAPNLGKTIEEFIQNDTNAG